jgi:RES domain-containing protein
MVDPSRLADAVARARPLAATFAALLFRATHLRHYYPGSPPAAPQPLFAAGGAAGSRYVSPGGPRALYLAQDADTAHRELCQDYYAARATVPGRGSIRNGLLRPPPCVLIGVHVRLRRVLDLRNRSVRQPLGIRAEAELMGPWFRIPIAPTRLIGEAAYNDTHFEGILYPSARRAGRFCLVAFPDRLDPGSRIEFRDTGTSGCGLAESLP